MAPLGMNTLEGSLRYAFNSQLGTYIQTRLAITAWAMRILLALLKSPSDPSPKPLLLLMVLLPSSLLPSSSSSPLPVHGFPLHQSPLPQGPSPSPSPCPQFPGLPQSALTRLTRRKAANSVSCMVLRDMTVELVVSASEKKASVEKSQSEGQQKDETRGGP